MKVSTPFNHWIPKEMRANLKWRAAVHRRVIEDPSYAEVIKDACRQDPLFFLNGFGWTYDPRQTPFTKLPFILYPFQEDALLEIIRAIKSYHLLIEKSRDMGVSWLCTAAYEWCWQYKKRETFLIVSRKEEYVDSPGDPKSLMWKWDFLIDNQPIWLQPEGYNRNLHRRSMHAENPDTLSVTDGESTNKDVARGDRRSSIFADEFSTVEGDKGYSVLTAIRYATDSVIYNFTPKGTNNAAYSVVKSNIRRIRLHWTVHPVKNIGAYTKHGDNYEFIDKKYWDARDNPENEMLEYDAKIIARGVPLPDGKIRSPWYAKQCEEAVNAREIAQELDIDYLNSGGKYFNVLAVQNAIQKYSRPPIYIGDLDFDKETGDYTKFREDKSGRLSLWCLLDKNFKPSTEHEVAIGIDVSAGTGASNSCAEIWDAVTCEKMGEYVNPFIRAQQFSKQVLALAKWFGNAQLIWESGGPGSDFWYVIKESGYVNYYLRKQEESISGKVSNLPGIAQSRETKKAIMSNYRDSIEGDKCINRSETALNETLGYVYGPDGTPEYEKTENNDPSGAGDNHGDRAMADALAWKLIKERNITLKKEAPVILEGSLAWRMRLKKQQDRPLNRELTTGWR